MNRLSVRWQELPREVAPMTPEREIEPAMPHIFNVEFRYRDDKQEGLGKANTSLPIVEYLSPDINQVLHFSVKDFSMNKYSGIGYTKDGKTVKYIYITESPDTIKMESLSQIKNDTDLLRKAIVISRSMKLGIYDESLLAWDNNLQKDFLKAFPRADLGVDGIEPSVVSDDQWAEYLISRGIARDDVLSTSIREKKLSDVLIFNAGNTFILQGLAVPANQWFSLRYDDPLNTGSNEPVPVIQTS